MSASAPYMQLEGSDREAVSAPGGPMAIEGALPAHSAQGQAEEVAQLRAMVAQQAAQQQILMQQIAAMQAQQVQQQAYQQQQQQQPQQYQPAPYPVPGSRNPGGPAGGYGSAAASRPIQQNMQYPQPAGQAHLSMCEVMGCRGVATGRCGSTTCCETCNKRICVEHSGWTRSGRGGRVAACPEHSRGQCVIS